MDQSPNHFIFVATSLRSPKGKVSSEEIWKTLAKNRVWYFTASAPYRNLIGAGDRILFYLGGKPGGGYFVGLGTSGGSIASLAKHDKDLLEQMGVTYFNGRLNLMYMNELQQRVPIKPIVESLTFIKDKKNYGLNLRLGIVHISEQDFNFVVDYRD